MAWTRTFDANGQPTGIEWVDENMGEASASPSRPQAQPQDQPEESPSVLTEAYRATVGAARDAAQETMETIDYLGDSITESVGAPVVSDRGLEWLSADEIRARGLVDPFWGDLDGMGYNLPEVAPNQTGIGSAVRGINQFLVGMVGGGRLLKGVGMGTQFLRGTGAAAVAARGAASGAVADFTVFDAYEDRFSDFLRDNVGLEDPITDYLAADEDDTVAEGKLKNVLEGFGLGIAGEALFGFTRLFRSAKRVAEEEGPEAGAQAMADGLTKLSDEVSEPTGQLNLFDEVTDPNLARPSAPGAQPDAFKRAEDAPPVVEGAADVRLWNAAGITPPTARPPSPINVDGFRQLWGNSQFLKAANGLPTEVDFTSYTEGRLFNHDYMDGAPAIKEVLNLAADAIDPRALPDSTTFDKIYNGARRELADATRTAPEALDAAIRQMAEQADRQKRVVVAGKMLIQDLAREINALAWKVDEAGRAGRSSTADEAKLIRYIERLGELEANLKNIITGAAQTTAAGRIRTRDVLTGEQLNVQDVVGQIKTAVDAVGGSKRVRKFARQIIEAGDNGRNITALMSVARRSRWGRILDIHNEYWINAILSGPKTHILNIMSNAMHTAILPAEKMIGGVLTGNYQAVREGARIYMGLRSGILDSIKMAGRAFTKGENILDPQGQVFEGSMRQYHAISSQAMGLRKGLLANTVDLLGTAARLPSRFLLAGDEFFKQLNYRAMSQSRLMDKAAELVQAGHLEQKDVARWVTDRMDQMFDAQTGQGLAQDPLAYAREVTFTRELEQGTIGKSVQQFVNRHPSMKIILPFVRTPTNIIRGFMQRTPIIGRLERQMRADLASGDPIRVAAAKGKQATGMALWAGATVLAMDGRITGGGPRDPELRQRLLETGWQPYSFVLGNEEDGFKYVSFQRLDPFGMFFGIAADIAEIGGHMGDTDLEDLAVMATTALARNLTSKTYLTGLIDAINVLQSPDRYAERWLQSRTASYVPYSSAMRQIRQQEDPAMREVWSIIDAIKNTIPGYSETLPARRSWITGEPISYPKGWGADMMSPVGEAVSSINPITQGEPKGNPVLDELARLQHGFSPPLKTIMNRQVELTSQQYSRLLELHGTIRLGRYTMQERLDRLMKSTRYTEGAGRFIDPDTKRIEMVREVIADYREAATNQLIREDPALQQAVQQARLQAGLRARENVSPAATIFNQQQ
jgi:hypothetical protein